MIILLVDDDDSDVELVERTLCRQDPEVTVLQARSCEETLAITAAQTIDCVVMDQRLIGTSGSECVKKLRESGYVGAFVLLTGFADLKTAVDAMKGGADNFLSKDHMHDELLLAIHAAVAGRAEAVRAQLQAQEQQQRSDAIVDRMEELLAQLKKDRRGS